MKNRPLTDLFLVKNGPMATKVKVQKINIIKAWVSSTTAPNSPILWTVF